MKASEKTKASKEDRVATQVMFVEGLTETVTFKQRA